MMILLKILFVLPLVKGKIYLYNTIDSPSVDFYDCILHESLLYCRRPVEPIALNRSQDVLQCHHKGRKYSFADLRNQNINISTVLHQWKSSIEKVEQYSNYLRNSSRSDGFVCQCIEPLSFGKNCEYMLPMGKTIAETFTSQYLLKRFYPRYVQIYGDVICYITLACNSGLLCLDWRDICDGVRQCTSGIDEQNCAKLEFNECESDEYRCMNGMCIPDEYFLDGVFDCLDWSDELQYYNDADCPIELPSIQCDDRICPANQFSCGDGQCIVDRFGFQKLTKIKSECRSRREQYRLCETHFIVDKWTLPNGRCHERDEYEELNVTDRTIDEHCEYLLKCALSDGFEKHCPCGRDSLCDQLLNSTCPLEYIQYPKGGIMAPYVLFFYDRILNYSVYSPDFLWINGTIICDGIPYKIDPIRLPFISDLHLLENRLCRSVTNTSATNDQYCHNRSNHLGHICSESKQCISTSRLRDGFVNCADRMDEVDSPSISSICSPIQRYRFRCSANQPTCLSITALGNLRSDCKNTFDEHWLGTSTQLSDINCNKLWKDQCEILREYVKNSWIFNSTNQVTTQFRIPFHYYCDTFWNLVLKEDENLTECGKWWVCSDDQWQCATGQCIHEKWVLDGEWDCSDASDEDIFSNQLLEDRNLRIVPFSTIMNRSTKSIPFAAFCNPRTEFPCLPINLTGSLDNLHTNRPCIDRHRIGDGRIDCYGAIDERNTITHCRQSNMLGYNYKCNSTNNECIPYWKHCLSGDRCSDYSDDWFWCNQLPNLYDFLCFNGTFLKDGRCDRKADCAHGEDEYMCEYQNLSKLTGLYYREEKENTAKNTERKLRLRRFPLDSNFTEPTSGSTSTTSPETRSPPDQSIAYWCNRGVGIEIFNGSIACFCPPQYYGDKCQYHADRITIRFHLDLSQSIYTPESDIQIVVKIVILFLYRKNIIISHVFHVRVASEYFIYTKKVVSLLYSRTLRSNTLNDHLYSIRIEMYERVESDEPVFIAVWQYSLDFHYLPVNRFAKVIRMIKISKEISPCSSNPCNSNQDCQPLMNDPSKYICLCKGNFTGDDCSIADPQCLAGHCFPGSICKPNYRGILIGNNLPYCICPFDQFGERCEIKHDQCSITPCLNNGTCYPASRPDSTTCICTEEYQGNRCQYRKPEVTLYINESVEHLAAVVQYFDIDFLTLNLILVHQEVYRILPKYFEHRHGQKTAPEIILVKLYSSPSNEILPEIYPISIHINVTTIYATSQVLESNRCVDIRCLLSDNDTEILSNDSPIKYHLFCRNRTDFFCFRDEFYVCLCDGDHSRVECFRYDSKLDQCSHCLAGGRCLKGWETTNFICLCPLCHSGKNCQFNSNSFAFTLEQLFFTDLILKIQQKTTLILLIIIPLLLFLVALPNNLFSVVTFRRQNCLRNGIGQYLLYMSLINQFNLGLLAARSIHIVLNITDVHCTPMVNHYLCKIFNYLLTSSSRMVYWLSSLVAIERVYMTLFLNSRWLNKPKMARRLIAVTVISILISHVHELVFVKSLFGVNDGHGGMCVIEFPIKSRSKWLTFHLIISIMNSIVPLLINICCTTTISYTIAKNKMNIRKKSTALGMNEVERSGKISLKTQFYFVLNVFSENKELIIGPAITLVPQLFSLPLFVISFTLYCQNLESSWVRYLLIVSYFTSFIPQLTSFMLYILPSSFYSNEWHETTISQWISVVFQSQRLDAPTSKTFDGL